LHKLFEERTTSMGALRLFNQIGEDIEVSSVWDLLDQSLED
jgi:hypothetical protein